MAYNYESTAITMQDIVKLRQPNNGCQSFFLIERIYLAIL